MLCSWSWFWLALLEPNPLKEKKRKVDGNSNVRFMSLFPVLSQNYLGPLTMVENIDKLLWTLADELWAERKSFTVSTKNMGTVFFASFSMTW